MKLKLMVQLMISIITLIMTTIIIYNFGIGLDELKSLTQFVNEGNLLYIWGLFALSIISIIINSMTLLKKLTNFLKDKVKA